ncbi:MAG: MobA-like NTP transferase domain containing protein, partial [Pseudomonadota bacterium]
TYLRFGDGDYSSCNLFCLMSPAAGDVVKFWQRAEQDRKRPWRIAWRFGIVSALRLLVGRPHLDQVFAIVSRRLSVDVKPIVLPFAEAAIDVDTEEDLTLVERSLSEKTA